MSTTRLVTVSPSLFSSSHSSLVLAFVGDTSVYSDSKVNMSSDERVLLNIGGTRFEVPRRTLSRFPDSLLGSLSVPDAESELECDASGVYFFDRYVFRAYRTCGMVFER